MKRLALRFGLALSTLALSLVAVEVAFRLLKADELPELRRARAHLLEGHAQFEPHAHTAYRHRPTKERLELVGMTDDRRGIRHPEGRRILCLGASTTESGNALGQIGSYPFYLQRLLKLKHGVSNEVLQGGVAGWTTAESLVAWMLDYSDFAPDLVLIHHAVNDVDPERAPGFRTDYSHWRRPLREARAESLERVLVRSSLLYVHFLRSRGTFDLVQNSTRRGVQQPASRLEPGEVFARNLEALGCDATRRGASVGLITMPMKPDVGSAELRAGVARNNECMRKLAARHGWMLVDIERRVLAEESIENQNKHFLDLVHVGPRGNFRKAEMIVETLLQQWPALAGSQPLVEEAR